MFDLPSSFKKKHKKGEKMEPDKRLSNKKVYVKDKSEEIQKKSFELGYEWGGSCNQIPLYMDAPFLYFDSNVVISFGKDMDNFLKDRCEEITIDYILSLQPEPEKKEYAFKPFDKVLARDKDNHLWMPNFFSFKDNSCDYPFCMINGAEYRQCIPYEGNEHLTFTNASPKQ